MAELKAFDESSHREYREEIESDLLVAAIRNASLLFIGLQTLLFIPADWILHPDHFNEFFFARLVENGLLAFVYFKWSRVNAVHATIFTAMSGSTLFLFMVHATGGVESGYYVGLILLLVGIAVLAPLSGKQSSLIAGGICLSYASLPITSHFGESVNWPIYFQNLFFLGSAATEAALACHMMDSMRFRDFVQKRELIQAHDDLAEMDRTKSRFSANVHHELRTPLTLILSPLDALRSGEFGQVPHSIEPILETMHSNGRRLHKMINNLLDLSKIESHQFAIVRRPTRVDRLVVELVSGARPMAERKKISLTTEGFETPLEMAVDPDALEKVLINLIGNALKFTGEGGAISVRGSWDGDGAEIRVHDTGIGIPRDKLSSIFDRFAQVDSSTTRKYEGTGIGLSLALEMVELHQGKIWAESEGDGRGTTMCIWLPTGMQDAAIEEDVLSDDCGQRMNVHASMAAIEADLNLEMAENAEDVELFGDVSRQLARSGDSREDPAIEYRSPGSTNRHTAPEILVAEDNPDMRQLLRTLLAKHYVVRVARNGVEALEKIRERKPDLVLSDIMMPEMDGTELCRVLKNDSTTSSIPIVLVTSKAEGDMKVEGLELGADDYVTKPFHPRELMARVGSLVRASVLRRELAQRNSQLTEALDELKRAEVLLVQQERLAAVGELAAGIAHEINNPVNFALNASRMLASNAAEIRGRVSSMPITDSAGQIRGHSPSTSRSSPTLDELGEEILELSGIITEGLERTNSLVSELKNFAAPSSSGRPQSRIDVSECLRSAVRLASATMAKSNIDISVDVPNGACNVVADEGAIGQVILNLLKNAADAVAEKGGKIGARVERSGTHIRLIVSDNGTGISTTDINNLFEPFFTTKPPGEGTGLGLAVSKQIITDHRGSIDVETSIGVGSKFIVTLPQAD